MKLRVLSHLINGVVAASLLSACAGTAHDAKKPAPVASKPDVETVVPEEPIIPILKPKTQKRAPASPRSVEVGADAAVSTDGKSPEVDAHQMIITGDTPQADNSNDDRYVASLPAPAVEPETVAMSASTPDELRSKAELEVATLLGPPVATRREGTGTIWTYRAGTCSLDVYFFLDVADNQRRALSYEVLPEGSGDAAVQSCYKTLKEAHHAP